MSNPVQPKPWGPSRDPEDNHNREAGPHVVPIHVDADDDPLSNFNPETPESSQTPVRPVQPSPSASHVLESTFPLQASPSVHAPPSAAQTQSSIPELAPRPADAKSARVIVDVPAHGSELLFAPETRTAPANEPEHRELEPREVVRRDAAHREAPHRDPLSETPRIERFERREVAARRDVHDSSHEDPAPSAMRWLIPLCGAISVLAIIAAALIMKSSSATVAPVAQTTAAQTGRVSLDSQPPGASVIVDGVDRGVTPLDLDLPKGSHAVTFRAGTNERALELKVDPGVRIAEHIELPRVVAPTVGVIQITSDPPGARVTVDGIIAGVTPLTVSDVAPGRHAVVLSRGANTAPRSVDVVAGATANVFAALPAPGAATGTLAVLSPVELRIVEHEKLLGVSNSAPIVLPAGRHQLDFVNEALDIRIARAVMIENGKPTRLNVAIPNGTLSVNASPWAEVFVDGRSIGTTPLSDISLPIGSHEIVWRHPQLGEKRRTVVVSAQGPTRVTMDLAR